MTTKETNTLARNVRQLREKRSMTQDELAAASGVGQSTISQIEAGVSTDARVSTVEALASALGVTVADLLK